MSSPLLSVRELNVVVHTPSGTFPVVKDVSFDIGEGEAVGVVGESGSGKSMTMLAVMGLHPRPVAEIVSGQVIFESVDLTKASEEHSRRVRGAGMAMVYQDPMTSLNPIMRVGDQITEALTAHGVSKEAAIDRTLEVLGQVGIAQPQRASRAYPHEFSGGMRQRVVIAIGLAMKPKLVIADEPTTALDVTIQGQILDLVRRLQDETGMAIVWITHDFGVIARIAQRVLVMYAGNIVEESSLDRIFGQPEHPYTASLMRVIPPMRGEDRGPLEQISGNPPDPSSVPAGCPFHPRCLFAIDQCFREMPPKTNRNGSSAACWVPPRKWRPQ